MNFPSHDCVYAPSSQSCTSNRNVSNSRTINDIRNKNIALFGPGVQFEYTSTSPSLGTAEKPYYANKDYADALVQMNDQYITLQNDVNKHLSGIMLAFVGTATLAILTGIYLYKPLKK